MTDQDWDGLSHRERDAEARKALWDYTVVSHGIRGHVMWREHRKGGWYNVPALTTTGNGMMLVMDAMRAKGFHYNAESFDDGTYRVEWAKPLGQNKGIQVAAANCNSLPEAAALAAVRAMEATNA